MSIHPVGVIIVLYALIGWVAPIILGFAFVLPDANRRGQPGWLWALLTIPLGWLALLVYLIVRAVMPTRG